MRNLEAGRLDRGDGRGRIGVLMAAGQARRRQVHQARLVLVDHAAVFFVGEEILAVDGDGRAEPVGGVDQHFLRRLGFLCADDDRPARLDDAGLLGGDQLDPVAEKRLVVDRDRHDQRHGRIVDDVGGVEAAAEPDLDDRGIGRMLRKQHEGHRGEYLEDGDRLAAIGLGDARHRFGKHPVLDQPAAARRGQAIALMPVDQVRRGMDVHG